MGRDLKYEVKGLIPDDIYVAIEKDLKISEDIDSEVDTAAVNFGYFAIVSEKAETRYHRAKFACESWITETEAKILREHRDEEKKMPTEAQMKALVRSQPKYHKFQRVLITLDEQRRTLKIIAKAFEMKKDLVQTKASNRREEMKRASGK